MAVAILLIAGFVVGQTTAIMVAAMAGVCIAIIIDHVLFGAPKI
jgi:hypothetical protein